MELLTEGSVRDQLDKEPCPLSFELKLRIAEQTAAGLHYLSTRSPPVLHRDIKSDNILLDAQFNAKVADFGLAKVRGRSPRRSLTGATPGERCGHGSRNDGEPLLSLLT